MVVILKYENDILEKLDKEVSKTRSTMKSLNYETSTIRIDFSKLLEIYEKQRKLVASLEDDIQTKKLETNVEVSQEIMTFLDKYAN
jgi:predicted nuclease with TOPRIM domain